MIYKEDSVFASREKIRKCKMYLFAILCKTARPPKIIGFYVNARPQNTISFMLFLGLFNASHHKLKIELASRIKFDSSTAAAQPLKDLT